jgi:DNA sulfur modification protein DndB
MKTWTIPCVRGLIGERVYYSTLMRADQIACHIQSAHQIREAKSLEDFLQRKLHDRCQEIARYLQVRPDRFFNSIIVGVFGGLPKWVPFDMTKAAADLGVDEEPKIGDSMGLLMFSGSEQMFAIDGQHRVEGIRIAHKKAPEMIAQDEYSVILVAHLDDVAGKVGTRRLFSDINKRAVSVSNGDKVIIDEDELNAIVARRLYADYRPFKKGKLIANTEKEKLPDGDTTHFTNLLTLYGVNKKLRKLHKRVPRMPEHCPENVAGFYGVASDFFDFVIRNVPSLHRYFVKRSVTLESQRKANHNLLFRPIGLVLLAQLYVAFASRSKQKELAKGLAKLQFESPGGVFNGVLLNSGKIESRAINRTAALNLCAYLLGLDLEEPKNLEKRLAEVTRNEGYKLPKRLL